MQEPADRSRGVLARLRALGRLRLVAAAAVATAFAVTVIGAGASPVGPTPVSDVLGLTGEHGTAVSDAVHEAKDAVADGDKVGPAVSEAACKAAHDPETLPDGAKAAHQAQKPEKDCTHPSNAESEEGNSGDEPAATDEAVTEDTGDTEETGDEELNHGQTVSQAVHDAKANLEDGEKVGPAVSEAACKAAHDRETLPDSANKNPGPEGKADKDCTHPSNATSGDGDEDGANSTAAADSKGKASAPGQQKKNH
jgi:hypothetical protein